MPLPVRTCVGCGGKANASTLLRWVVRDGNVTLDPGHRLDGRGAWLHPSSACLENALRRRAFDRAFRARVNASTATDQLRLVINEEQGESPGPQESGLEADGHPMSTQR